MAEAIHKAADEKFCSECGAIIKAKAEICPKCGVRQFAPPNNFAAIAPNGKSKLAAALFALFLGGLGIHKFYLGRIGWGVFYLLFCLLDSYSLHPWNYRRHSFAGHERTRFQSQVREHLILRQLGG